MTRIRKTKCPRSNAELLERLDRKYGSRLRRWVARRTAGTIWRSDVDDIVQDAFLAMWRLILDGYHRRRHFGSRALRERWFRAMLFRICRFRLSHLVRRHRPFTNVGSLDRDPGLFVDHVIRRMTIEEALECCPDPSRRTITMQAAGYGDLEIACQLGVTETCVRKRRERARERLRRQLGA